MRLEDHSVQEILEAARTLFHCTGISLTLTDRGAHRSFQAGFADVEQQKAMTADTILPIGSSTKAFTAEAICILADRGQLDLDKTVKSYLPELRMYDTYAQEHLTVRDLLCHRCGLPRHDFLWYAHESATEEELLGMLPYLRPFASFREKYQYNNLMFAVAGFLIERIDGRPWARFVAEEIVSPIGADRVSFSVEEMRSDDTVAVGYGYDSKSGKHFPLPYKQLTGIRAAGSINASTAQMIKWIDLQLNLGQVGTRRVISEKNMAECHSPQTLMGRQPLSLPGNDFESYGLGWMMQRCKGHKLIHHGGNIDGFAAMHFFLPEDSFGASILTNTGNCAARSAVMYALADLLLGEDWKPGMETIRSLIEQQRTQLEAEKEALLRTAPTVPQTISNARLCGIYAHPGYGVLTVEERGGVLQGTIGALSENLIALSQNIFKMEPRDGELFLFQFTLGLDGQVSGCETNLEAMLTEPIRFQRQSAKQEVSHV